MSQVVALLIINKLEITFVLLGFSPLMSYCAIKIQMRCSLFPKTHTHTLNKRPHTSIFLLFYTLSFQLVTSFKASRKQGSFREYGNDILLKSALQKIKSHMREIRRLKEVVGCMILLDLIHIIGSCSLQRGQMGFFLCACAYRTEWKNVHTFHCEFVCFCESIHQSLFQ